jgi:hypothetical protein
MAFPIIPKKRSGASGYPTTLEVGELAVNTLDGSLYLGGDSAVMLLNGPVAAGTTVTEHTGDGTTVAFTFAGYNGTADGGYIVSVGGIDQPPSKYAITSTAGGTITFVEAPVAGELISIRALVAGSGGGGSGDATSLQGRAIAATEPTNAQVLTWIASSNEWAPALASTNATQLQNRAVALTEPTDGQVLAWDNTALAWTPTTSSGGSSNATQLQGTDISTTAPSTGQGLVYNGTEWAPAAPSANATQLQGINVSLNAPNNKEGLIFNSSLLQWQPSVIEGNAISINGISCGTANPTSNQGLIYSGPDVGWIASDIDAVKIQTQPVASTVPSIGNLLRFDGTNWAPFDGYAIANWVNSTTYNPGDVVWYNGKIWNCVNMISGQAPGPDTAGSWIETLGINLGTPSNTSTPVAWLNVQTAAAQGWIPIYQ